MTPVDFLEAMRSLGAPKGMSECDPLPVADRTVNGLPCVVSCWELTDDELAQVVATKRVWLAVVSGNGSQPPVILSGHRLT